MVVSTKLLTAITILNHILGLLLHRGSIITQCKGPMIKRSNACMVSINTLVDLSEHIVSLLGGETAEERMGKRSTK